MLFRSINQRGFRNTRRTVTLPCWGRRHALSSLAQGLAELGLTPPETPSPLNLFMNIPWTLEGALSFEPPVSTAGCYIRLRAAIDLVIAFSACPQDILPINGRAGKPTEAHFRIEL